MNIREQRRSFIKKSSTLAAGLMVAPGIIRAQENKPKLNIGLIGLSGKGASLPYAMWMKTTQRRQEVPIPRLSFSKTIEN